jgi:hypothetical protein
MEITLPVPAEFAEYCASNGLTAAQVLQAFMADLAETDDSNGSDERMHAAAWFERVLWPETAEYSFQVDPRTAEQGGGWQLCLMIGREEAGGGVFPADPADQRATDEAYDDAVDAGESWVASVESRAPEYRPRLADDGGAYRLMPDDRLLYPPKGGRDE